VDLLLDDLNILKTERKVRSLTLYSLVAAWKCSCSDVY
jgi:hypothetical protein